MRVLEECCPGYPWNGVGYPGWISGAPHCTPVDNNVTVYHILWCWSSAYKLCRASGRRCVLQCVQVVYKYVQSIAWFIICVPCRGSVNSDQASDPQLAWMHNQHLIGRGFYCASIGTSTLYMYEKNICIHFIYSCISLLVLPCYQTHWSLFATPPVKGAAPAAPAPAAPLREPLSRRALTARAGNEEVFLMI